MKRLLARLKNLIQLFISLLFSPFRLLKWLCLSLGLVVILISLGFGAYLVGFHRSLPTGGQLAFNNLKTLAQKRVLSKRENKNLHLKWVPLKDISRDSIYAIVTSEDSNFFEHGGVDFDAVIDSLAENLRKRKYEYGASTISQQVVKNLFLTSEKSLIRKVKEILITERIENARSKNEILEVYLNIAEFGRDLFGIAEASRFYFKKSPAKLNAAEASFLAILLPSPRKFQYAIFENKNLTPAKKRKIRRILGDMLAQEYISLKQYRHYSNYPYFTK